MCQELFASFFKVIVTCDFAAALVTICCWKVTTATFPATSGPFVIAYVSVTLPASWNAVRSPLTCFGLISGQSSWSLARSLLSYADLYPSRTARTAFTSSVLSESFGVAGGAGGAGAGAWGAWDAGVATGGGVSVASCVAASSLCLPEG